MQKTLTHAHPKSSAADAAVSGLFAGLLGGLAMAAVIAAFSVVAGKGVSYLGNFSSGAAASPIQGLLMHLGVSSIYGILYGLLYRWFNLGQRVHLPGWLSGVIYAIVLWLFAVTLLLPATGALILALPWWVFLSGHLAYGLVLGARQNS